MSQLEELSAHIRVVGQNLDQALQYTEAIANDLRNAAGQVNALIGDRGGLAGQTIACGERVTQVIGQEITTLKEVYERVAADILVVPA